MNSTLATKPASRCRPRAGILRGCCRQSPVVGRLALRFFMAVGRQFCYKTATNKQTIENSLPLMLLFRRLLRYVFAFRPSKQMFNALLPRSARRRIASGLDLDTGPFNRPIDDLELIPVQPDSYLAVYFKRYDTDIGPGISLYVFENEILRFDCFGADRGHYHSLPCLAAFPAAERIAFAAESVEMQVNCSAEEIGTKHATHLTRHFRRCIREFRFEQTRLDAALAEARDRMLRAHRRNLALTDRCQPRPAPFNHEE